jgi:hypothetical protein
MKISKARLKEIIKEELRETIDVSGPLEAAVGDIEFTRAAKKNAAARKERGETSTIAGTQNLDHLAPGSGDPEEEFFGDKIDPDEVGLQTGEWTPEQFRKFMRRKKR